MSVAEADADIPGQINHLMILRHGLCDTRYIAELVMSNFVANQSNGYAVLAFLDQISGMYAPELRGNSDEFKLKIKDK